MVTTLAQHTITTLEELRALIPQPKDDSLAVLKERAALDEHCRAVIATAPFVLLSTAGADGRCDVTPRGDGPGFVQVLDDTTLAVPERPGNRRIDSLRNIIANPHAGLLFLVPGMDETLRVNGRASLTTDPELLARMTMRGKQPQIAILLNVDEVFFHCARAFKRARLWEPDTWADRDALPSFAQILNDQIHPPDLTIEDLDRRLEESNRNLY